MLQCPVAVFRISPARKTERIDGPVRQDFVIHPLKLGVHEAQVKLGVMGDNNRLLPQKIKKIPRNLLEFLLSENHLVSDSSELLAKRRNKHPGIYKGRKSSHDAGLVKFDRPYLNNPLLAGLEAGSLSVKGTKYRPAVDQAVHTTIIVQKMQV